MSDHSLQTSAQPIAAPEPLEQALALQSRMPLVRIGEALLALGFVDERQLGDALARQTQERHLPLGELLVMSQAISRQQLEQALVHKMGFPVVDAGRFPVEADAIREVPVAQAQRLCALPLMVRGHRLIVALEDPSARMVIDELEHCTALKVVPVLALTGTLRPAIVQTYVGTGTTTTPAQPTAQPAADDGLDQPASVIASRLIERIIADTRSGAVTHVHVESDGTDLPLTVRARRGGVLVPYARLPAACRDPLVEQLKAMAQLDRGERTQPQVGLIEPADGDEHPPLQVTTIPTVGGQEDVVVRRRTRPRLRALTDLGLTALNLAAYTAAIEHASGLVLCVGPEASGRTTTMHAALAHLNTPERKIWTAEQSVEIIQRGVRQMQVRGSGEPSALSALRAIAQADADVVMVDELDDRRAARLVVDLAASGVLVLAAMTGSSACGAVSRLMSMGIDGDSLADALRGVLDQRMVRRLCPHCMRWSPADGGQLESLRVAWCADSRATGSPAPAQRDHDPLAHWLIEYGRNGVIGIPAAVGCPHCDGTGYRGHIGVHEWTEVDRQVLKRLQTTTQIDLPRLQGPATERLSLCQDAIEKVLTGMTTVAEVNAICNI
ncbi:MAG: Flp pilus assembly complex ATPase component TadA [Burkholderiaceae bacterium]|nr:Flp pilus assembly complex ATPase component TadA [Aquabacterium sp.]NUP84549.1 Flp pilus assembly complex ATPase component TadA [Burkholderiaceae bacterium]